MNKRTILSLGIILGVSQLLQSQSVLSPYFGFDFEHWRVAELTNPVHIYTGLSSATRIDNADAGFSLDFGGGIVATFSVIGGHTDRTQIRVYSDSTGTGNDGDALAFTLESLTGGLDSLALSHIALASVEPDDALLTLSGIDWFGTEGGDFDPALTWFTGETLEANNLFVDPGTYNVVGFTVTAVPEPTTTALLLGGIALSLVFLRRLRRS